MCVCGGGGGGTSLQNSWILAISDVRLQIVDFSLWFKKSDHVITSSFFPWPRKEKKPEEKFPPASYFLRQGFSWVTHNRPLLLAVNIVSRFSLWGEQQKIASRDRYFRGRRATKNVIS